MASNSAPWFVYLIDDKLLEKNFAAFNSNKLEGVEMMSLFLHHADLISLALKDSGEKKEDLSASIENNKVMKLRYMAVKLACLLQWDVDFLNKNLSLGKMYSLLINLVRICCGENQPINCNFQQPITNDTINNQLIINDSSNQHLITNNSTNRTPINLNHQQPIVVDFFNLKPHAFFSLVLYHSWCVMMLVQVNIPLKPHRIKSQVPGFVDPLANTTVSKEQIIQMIKDNEENSLEFMENLSSLFKDGVDKDSAISFASPSFYSVKINFQDGHLSGSDIENGGCDGINGGTVNDIGENNNNNNNNNNTLKHDWSRAIKVPCCEVMYHINWVSANYHFLKCKYKESLQRFYTCKELLKKIITPVFVKPHVSKLEGFIIACQGICKDDTHPSSTLLPPTPSTTSTLIQNPPHAIEASTIHSETPSIYQRINRLDNHDSNEDLYDLLKDDLVSRALSMVMREGLERKIERDSPLYHKVVICNEVCRLLEGRCVGMVTKALVTKKPQLADVLIKILSDVVFKLDTTKQKLIKIFLLTLSLTDINISDLISNSSCKSIFTHQELLSLKTISSSPSSTTSSTTSTTTLSSTTTSLTSLSSSLLTTSSSSLTSITSPALSVEEFEDLLFIKPDIDEHTQRHNTEQEMMSTCNIDRMYELATLIYKRYWSSKTYIAYFFEKWRLPNDIFMCLNSMNQLHHISILVHVVFCKTRNLLILGQCEKAKKILRELEIKMSSNNKNLNKLIQYEQLRCDLIHNLQETFITKNDTLITKCKLCLFSTSIGDLPPSHELKTLSMTFLMDASCHDVVLKLPPDSDLYVQFCQLLSSLCVDISQLKRARLLAKTLMENVALMFPCTHVKKAKLVTLSTHDFLALASKMQSQILLSLLVSCLCRLLKLSDHDMNEDIHNDYLIYWPASIPNQSLDRDQILESLLVLLKHALSTKPNQLSWLRTKAELCFVLKDHKGCLESFVYMGIEATCYFVEEINKNVYDDEVYRKMIQSCMHLNYYTIAAVICQFVEEVDYATCFKCLQEQCPYDAMDLFYSFIYDITILEFIINLHHKRGAMERRNQTVKLMSRLDINSHNRSEVVANVVENRKSGFFRALTRLMVVTHKHVSNKNDQSLYLKYLTV